MEKKEVDLNVLELMLCTWLVTQQLADTSFQN